MLINSFSQEIEEPERRDTVLNLALINSKGLVGNMKLQNRLVCSDHGNGGVQYPYRNKEHACYLGLHMSRLWSLVLGSA